MSTTQLEQTIDKILLQTQEQILSGMDSATQDARRSIDDAIPMLEQEYDKIISDAQKESDKVHRQIVGSADLEVRNRQLLALEDAADRVFAQALDRVASADRNGSEYAELLSSLVAESVSAIGSQNVIISTSAQDRDAVVRVVSSQYPDSEVSSEPLDCLGGIIVRSRDGAMTFDNTLDARIERLKPLIRKQVASRFGAST